MIFVLKASLLSDPKQSPGSQKPVTFCGGLKNPKEVGVKKKREAGNEGKENTGHLYQAGHCCESGYLLDL